MKQTAVEWLCEQYHLKQDIEIVEQAKEMEKQHIFDARLKGIFEGIDYEQKQNSVLQQFRKKTIMKNKLIYGYILGLLTSLVVMILVNLLK